MSAPTKKKKSRPKRNEAQIPEWWLELNDGLFFTLDLEDEKSRRLAEERMALYYSQLVDDEMAKGMMFDIDGNPLSAEEAGGGGGSGGGWKSNWTGRQKKDGDNNNNAEPEKPKMFGGRNFKPGSDGWDPKQWGIDANDPDYDKYLKGEMLPPQYIAAMNNFAKATGHYKSDPNYTMGLRSTEGPGGAYGRMGEKQPHQPDWMKKKLRSTSQGQSIRHGVYDDSPNKHLKYQRRVDETGETLPEQGDDDDAEPNPAEQQENVAMNSRPAAPEAPPPAADPEPEAEPSAPEPKPEPPKPTWQHKDYYYNAPKAQQQNTAKAPAPAAPSWVKPVPAEEPEPPAETQPQEEQPQDNGTSNDNDNPELFANPDNEEEYEEEEYVEEEEYEEEVEEEIEEEEYEEEVEEEIVEEGGGDDGSLEDLQATLAAKMEELKRLQATQG